MSNFEGFLAIFFYGWNSFTVLMICMSVVGLVAIIPFILLGMYWPKGGILCILLSFLIFGLGMVMSMRGLVGTDQCHDLKTNLTVTLPDNQPTSIPATVRICRERHIGEMDWSEWHAFLPDYQSDH